MDCVDLYLLQYVLQIMTTTTDEQEREYEEGAAGRGRKERGSIKRIQRKRTNDTCNRKTDEPTVVKRDARKDYGTREEVINPEAAKDIQLEEAAWQNGLRVLSLGNMSKAAGSNKYKHKHLVNQDT